MSTRILVVDDSAAIRHSLRSYIEAQTDWEISEAENGKVAVQRVQELGPDIVILDLSMPVMNGLDSARQIREIVPDVYILLLTIHSYPQLSADARAVGVNAVVSKSGDVSTLLSAVRSSPAA
jgi:DNA-binding NarL/FixJ family response regulator